MKGHGWEAAASFLSGIKGVKHTFRESLMLARQQCIHERCDIPSCRREFFVKSSTQLGAAVI